MNEIIVYGQNYKLSKGIEVFIQSAKKTGSAVTVIGYGLEEKVINYIKSNNCNYIDTVSFAIKNRLSALTAKMSPYTLKVVLAYVYLKTECKADNVYICDFTDIYFQKNIFNFVKDKPVVFEEGRVVKECPVNTEWIQICYDKQTLDFLKDKLIINGGGILGSTKECTALLEEMCKEIPSINAKTNNYTNIDQAILNKIIHYNSDKYYIESYNVVVNMAHYNNKLNIHVNNNEILADNATPAVLHQYECNKEVEKYIFNTIQ